MTPKLIILTLSILLCDGCRQYQKIKLDKIIFHTSHCFGSCPAYHSQINSGKTLLLYSEYMVNTPDINADINNPDSSRIGYFTGRVSDQRYTELVNELENIALDDLQFDGTNCCDGSTKTIIVYYNGKRKFLKSMFPPKEAGRLISLLKNISESTSTQRTKKIFQIEDKE